MRVRRSALVLLPIVLTACPAFLSDWAAADGGDDAVSSAANPDATRASTSSGNDNSLGSSSGSGGGSSTGSSSSGPDAGPTRAEAGLHDSGGGSSASSSGSGSGSSSGSPSGEDASTNADGPGLEAGTTDSTSCSGTCVAEVQGWQVVEASFTGASCLAAGWTNAQLAYDGLTVPPATCGCSCPPVGGCSVSLSLCSGTGGCTACASPVTLIQGVCTAVPGVDGGSSYVSIGSVAGDGGSCAPQTSKSVPPVSWSGQVRYCSAAALPACGGGGVCVPVTDPGFTVCVAAPGDVACRPPYITRHLEYAGASDSRDCSACTCTGAPGCTQGGAIFGSSDAACTNRMVGGTFSANACFNEPSTGPYAIFTGGASSCTPSSVSPTGSAMPANPTTLCCQ